MKHGNLELHNIAATAERPAGTGGEQLVRVPFEVGRQMSARGRWNSQATGGSEIRFVTEAPHFRAFLSSLEGDAEVLVFRGENHVQSGWVKPGQVLCLHVYAPENTEPVRTDDLARGSRFAPHVWRIMLGGYQTVLHEIDTFGWEVRPPRSEERPATRWLAYGSSITAGCGAARTDLSYVQVAARCLGVDVLNMGFGGACHCENALADFFAGDLTWDFATLELGVNMRGSFEPEEFADRAGYMIDRLLHTPPPRPLVLITPFVTGGNHHEPVPDPVRRQHAYEEWMRNRVARDDTDRLHLLDGQELLGELHALNADMVHPGAYGHTLIGERLASVLASRIPAVVGGNQ